MIRKRVPNVMTRLAKRWPSVLEATWCLVMVALCNRTEHYIFAVWFLSFFFFPRLISAVGECMSEMRCTLLAENTGRKKSPFWHHRTILSGCRPIFAAEACIDNRKNLLNIDTSSTCPHNMVNFGILKAEICWRVWGTPSNFNGFRVLAALLHDTLVVGVSQTLRRWTEGATYVRQGDHHFWPTF